jgi:hypothetical protein
LLRRSIFSRSICIFQCAGSGAILIMPFLNREPSLEQRECGLNRSTSDRCSSTSPRIFPRRSVISG